MEKIDQSQFTNFVMEVKEKIRTAQYEALKAVNQQLIALYWDLGGLIVKGRSSMAGGNPW